jgi:hypothetical protein
MRKPRSLVSIPRQLAVQIDRIVGHRQRATFVIELVEREIRRREQLEALRDAAGSWKDENHAELDRGGDHWISEMRRNSVKRLEGINKQREAE